MRTLVLRSCAATFAVLFGSGALIEARHHSIYGHWFDYGWHVDVLSDRLSNPDTGNILVHYVAVTNFGLLPGAVEGCIPNDPQGGQIPVSASHLETQERSGWKSVGESWPLPCDGQLVKRTLWPLMSFYTEPKPVEFVGKRGDWVRLVASPSFSAPHRGELVSVPFQLSEGAPKRCPKECIAISSLQFCEALPAGTPDDNAASCKKLDEWRDRSGSAHPPTVDIAFEIRNAGDRVFGSDDFVALATADSLIAPTHSYGLADLDKMRTTVGWNRGDELRMTIIRWLKGQETRFVRIRGFSIQQLLNQFEDGSTALWPWWIRVNLRIEDWGGEQVAAANVALPLIPSDRRLAERIQAEPEDHHLIRRRVIAPRQRRLW